MPTTSVASRQLQRVVIGVRAYGQGTSEPSYFIDGEVNMAGAPTGDPDAEINLGFGHRQGGTCNLVALLTKETGDYWGTRYEFVGYNPDYFPTPSRPWNCVAVFLDDSFSGSPATNTYDAFVGPLRDTRHSPRVAITKVSLLGKGQRSLRLVRGVPTRIDVDLRNSGKVSTARLQVRGAGKGLKVTGQRIDPISSKSTGSASLKIRLSGRQRQSKVRIVVSGGGIGAARTLRVTRVPPPRRPVSGNYRSPSGDVSFSVKRGRIIGWHGRMTTRCGGYPGNFYYTTNTYSFPSVKVPRNGIVQASDKAKLYTTWLRLRFAGSRVTEGYFAYYGPDRCFASVNFKAKRRR